MTRYREMWITGLMNCVFYLFSCHTTIADSELESEFTSSNVLFLFPHEVIEILCISGIVRQCVPYLRTSLSKATFVGSWHK